MAKTISIKASDLATGQTASMRDLKYTPDGGTETTVKVLATAAVTIPPKPEREEGVLAIVSVKSFTINGSKLVLTFGTANTITGEAGDDITKEINGAVENIVQSVDYDGSAKKFTQTVKSALVLGGGTATDSDIVSLVSHASQHVEE